MTGRSAVADTTSRWVKTHPMDLATHGGPTPTRLPGALSIAINAGRESFCTATDQRRFARADASCDIGAVEVGAMPSTGAVFANGFE